MLFCLLSTLLSLENGQAPYSSTPYLIFPTLHFGASAMRLPQGGLGLEERILSHTPTKNSWRLTRPRLFHRQRFALSPKHGIWLPAKEFPFPKGDCPGEMAIWEQLFWCSLATHFVDFLKCIFLWGFCFFSGLVCDFTSFLLTLIIWTNIFVFIWFFFSDFWHIWPVAHFAVWYATLCLCFVWSPWKPKFKQHGNELEGVIQTLWLKQRLSC